MRARRRYDTASRLDGAAARRARVLDVARTRFLQHGYGRTALAAIAAEADVSTEFIHKAFGGKAGLVRAIHDRSVLGAGARPAPDRSDEVQRSADDLESVLLAFGSFSAEVAPLVAPIELLIRDAAAAGDPRMTGLWEEVQAERLARMRENAARLHARGLLPATMTAPDVADVFWAMTGADLYRQLVIERGWAADRYGRFIATCLLGALTG